MIRLSYTIAFLGVCDYTLRALFVRTIRSQLLQYLVKTVANDIAYITSNNVCDNCTVWITLNVFIKLTVVLQLTAYPFPFSPSSTGLAEETL